MLGKSPGVKGLHTCRDLYQGWVITPRYGNTETRGGVETECMFLRLPDYSRVVPLTGWYTNGHTIRRYGFEVLKSHFVVTMIYGNMSVKKSADNL